MMPFLKKEGAVAEEGGFTICTWVDRKKDGKGKEL